MWRNFIQKLNNKEVMYIKEKFVILVELIKTINILSLSIIIAFIFSVFNINKYIIFILVMIIGVLLSNFADKINAKYITNSNLIYQSKSLFFLGIFLDAACCVYYFLIKEYMILFLLILFLCLYSLYKKIININCKNW